MTAEQRFRQTIQGLLRINVKPTPTTINRFLDRMHRTRPNQINGREANWRRQELLAAGWTAPRILNADRYWDEHTAYSHWEPPA